MSYDEENSSTDSAPSGASPSCFVIGVAGGTASGKTTVCDLIMQHLHEQCVVILSQDSFYKGLNEEELKNVKEYNFDIPNAIDVDSIVYTINTLKMGQSVNVPIYDFVSHQRSKESRRVDPADVIIIEGIMLLHIKEIRDLLNMKVFVDTDDDVRLARRIQRDVAYRGRSVDGVIQQYTNFVKPAFIQYVAPSRKYADIIIPWQKGNNYVAIDIITEHIRTKLNKNDLRRIYPNLHIMQANYQTKGMHTIIRDRDTSMSDFVFYSDRLIRLVVETGLGHLPFVEKAVTTPMGKPYIGVDFAKKLCGVSIIRGGEAMENALRACCKSIKIGKILVHRHPPPNLLNNPNNNNNSCSSSTDSSSNTNTKSDCDIEKPMIEEDFNLIYEKLPRDISERHVFLMDPILGSGYAASKCIQILKDKGVPEDNILLLNLIAAPQAIHRICTQFPRVKLMTSEIDEGIDESFKVIPGIGDFGAKYFGD